jgi:broad specificity phosphatase PhoE
MTYLYHCTSTDRIPSIAKEGLKPSEDSHWGGDLGASSQGKVFFADSPEHAYYFGEIVFRQTMENYGLAFPPVVLRVRTPEDAVRGTEDSSEFYVERTVPSQEIEVSWHGWKPVRSARGDWENMGYTLNEEEGLYEDWEGTPFDDLKDVLEDAKQAFLVPAMRIASSGILKEGKDMPTKDKEKPTVCFLRHGHTPYNSTTGDSMDSRIRGWVNVPLDEEGKQQAKEVAQKFNGKEIKEIYSSDLDRAAYTAKEVAKVTKAPLRLIPNLRPWDMGDWSGDLMRDHIKELEALMQNFDEAPPGGKPFREFYDRAVAIVHWLQARAEKVGTVVAVTHSRLLLALPCILSNGDPTTIPLAGGPANSQVIEVQKVDGNWAMRTLEDELIEDKERQSKGKNADYSSHKRGTAMKVTATELTDAVMKIAGVLCEADHPNDDQELQAIVGDPLDTRTSTFAQFKPNPGTLQMPNPLSPIEGDEIFFAYMIPGAVFQAHDGSEWNILFYDNADSIQIENRWYPRITWYVSIGDIRRSIHQWIEPVTQTVPPPPPGVDYSSLPVKIMDDEKNKGNIDSLTDQEVRRGSGW